MTFLVEAHDGKVWSVVRRFDSLTNAWRYFDEHLERVPAAHLRIRWARGFPKSTVVLADTDLQRFKEQRSVPCE